MVAQLFNVFFNDFPNSFLLLEEFRGNDKLKKVEVFSSLLVSKGLNYEIRSAEPKRTIRFSVL